VVRILVSTIIALTYLSACATYNPDKTAHYRQVHGNLPVEFQFIDNTNNADNEVEQLSGTDRVIYESVAGLLPDAIGRYLESNDIPLARSGPSRKLRFSFDGVRVVRIGGIYVDYLASISVESASGVTRTHKIMISPAGLDNADSLARRLARAAIDDALLVWHPALEVVGNESPGHNISGATLFPVYPADRKDIIDPDQPLTLEWEAFPSDRLLAGSGISRSQISEVSYDIRIVVEKSGRARILEKDRLNEARFAFTEALPYCGEFSWGVRARFLLGGHRRTTEWSANQGMLGYRARQSHSFMTLSAPYDIRQSVGLSSRLGAPEPFKCYGGLYGNQPVGRRAVSASATQVQLVPIAPGQGVASIVLTGSRCKVDENACSDKIHKKNNKALWRKLDKAISKLETGVEVHDGVSLMDEAWIQNRNNAYEITLGDLYAWIGDPSNKESMAQLGINRIIAIHSEDEEFDIRTYDTSNVEIELFMTFGSKTAIGLSMYADVIDVASGKRLAQLDITATGSESSGLAIILLIPIPYSTDIDAFEEGIEEMATIGAYALMGARLGWPDGFVPLVEGAGTPVGNCWMLNQGNDYCRL
jgi:hypothetical protein